jgi:hypothetical protein
MLREAVLLAIFTASIGLMEPVARSKFAYLHPRDASTRDIAKFPKELSFLLVHHDLAKRGGAFLFWISGIGLAWLEPANFYLRNVLYVVCAAGLVFYSLTLSWRVYVIAKR